MIRLANYGPYTGTGTTYEFGNTRITVPSQYVISPASNGSDVRSIIQWLNALGFYSAAYGSTPANPGNATLIKYGALYIWIPNANIVPGNPTASLYSLITTLTGTAALTTGATGSTAGASGAVSTATNWLTGSTIIPGIPNYLVAVGGFVGYRILRKVV